MPPDVLRRDAILLYDQLQCWAACDGLRESGRGREGSDGGGSAGDTHSFVAQADRLFSSLLEALAQYFDRLHHDVMGDLGGPVRSGFCGDWEVTRCHPLFHVSNQPPGPFRSNLRLDLPEFVHCGVDILVCEVQEPGSEIQISLRLHRWRLGGLST